MSIRRWFASRNGVTRAVGAVIVCAIGARIVAPGINGQVLADFFRSTAGPLLRLYDWLVGGAIGRGALLALGLMPYITARIYLRFGATALPKIGEIARRKANVHGLTFGLALVQSYGFARFVEAVPGVVSHPGAKFIATTMAVLTASAMTATWLCEPTTADEHPAPNNVGESSASSTALEQPNGEQRLLAVPVPMTDTVGSQEPKVAVRL